ncbi:hypothetical protein N0V82_000750 [Gnomoniopsis sp. IMI 355080]|nr:hypothetical protein N0V82_000750 [Gnomoniopsis sp. IMI 355080]
MLDNIHSLSIYIPGIFHYTSDSDDDTMGSPTPDSRRSSGMSRRDSTRSNPGGRRPRLLRSVATEASITPSTASRNGLASPRDTRRATDLLNQFSSSPPNPSSPLSQSPSSIYDGPSMTSLPREGVDIENFRPHLDSNRYYSFPSFDTWEPDHSEQDHREPEMKTP